MRRYLLPAAIGVPIVLGLLALLLITPRGYTQLTLTDLDTGRTLLSTILQDGTPVTLRWHNSIYDLPVVEEFSAHDGRLVLDTVTFEDPRGVDHAPVTPTDVKDLYHTGGPFSATGMDRPYENVIFRIGEIGDPKLTAGGQTVALKAEVGFGGRVRLHTGRPRLFAILKP